jgi:fructokinase
MAVAAAEPVSLAIVSVEADGSVAYDFRVEGTADWQWSDAELERTCDGSVAALHVGSLAMMMAPGAEALFRFVDRARAGAIISYDPNCRPLLMGPSETVRPRVESLVACADVVKVSEEDIAWLLPGQPPEKVARSWLGLGPSLVAVTCGSAGVLAMTRRGAPIWSPARHIQVVDVVGAGDSFMSGLRAGLYRRDLLRDRACLGQLETSLFRSVVEEAVAAAAITCSRRGADPPTADELQAAMGS